MNLQLEASLKLLEQTLNTGINLTIEHDSSNGFKPSYKLGYMVKDDRDPWMGSETDWLKWEFKEFTSEEEVIQGIEYLIKQSKQERA